MPPSHTSLPADSFGPTLRGGRGRVRSRMHSGLLVFLAGAGALLLVGAVAIAAILWHGTRQVTRVEIPDLATPGQALADDGDEEEDTPAELTDVLNILIAGSDSREGLTDEQLERLGTHEEDGTRTDTIMLVQLDPRRDQVSVLSFPRDLLVTRCDGSRGRINAAYSIGERDGMGGGTCLVRTVRDFTGIPVHHFVKADFVGFVGIVDALGGVTLYLDEPLRDARAGLDLPAGCVEIDGVDALSFVRAREVDPHGDFGRIARQQRFIHEVVTQATSLGTLVNVPRLYSLVDAGARAVETDEHLTIGEMRRIAYNLRDLEPDRLDTRTVPAVPREIEEVAFLVAKEEEAEGLFQAFRDATLVPEGVGTTGPQPVRIGDVPPVTVLNGAGVEGLAAVAAEQLEALGAQVADTGNADTFDVTTTRVLYPPGLREEAELVAAVFEDPELVADGEGDDLTVVLGRDYDPDVVAQRLAEPSPGAADPEAAPTPDAPYAGATPTNGRC